MRILTELTYERHSLIGTGKAMNSSVYLATDLQLGGDFAVKEIPKKEFKNSVQGYFEEAQAVFAARHPNVVPIQYAGESADSICLMMEHFPEGSLLDRIKAGPVKPSVAISLGIDVLHALTAVHKCGYVHLDIKPSNILLTKTGRGVLADFGQARELDSNGVLTPPPPMYVLGIPPECIQNHVALRESDIFQVGLTLYRALNGEPVFRPQRPTSRIERDSRVLSGHFPDRENFLPHIPRRLKAIVRKALRVDPANRYRDVIEFERDLARTTLALDWAYERKPGEETWHVERPGKATLRVRKAEQSNSRFAVEVHTSSAAGRRARRRSECWCDKLTAAQCDRHLRKVFRLLEAE